MLTTKTTNGIISSSLSHSSMKSLPNCSVNLTTCCFYFVKRKWKEVAGSGRQEVGCLVHSPSGWIYSVSFLLFPPTRTLVTVFVTSPLPTRQAPPTSPHWLHPHIPPLTPPSISALDSRNPVSQSGGNIVLFDMCPHVIGRWWTGLRPPRALREMKRPRRTEIVNNL